MQRIAFDVIAQLLLLGAMSLLAPDVTITKRLVAAMLCCIAIDIIFINHKERAGRESED